MSTYPSLFKIDRDAHNNACLNFLADMSYGYIKGYLRAGDILADHVDEHARDQDTLIYPIIFCYRHHLELRMKEIIKSGRELLDGSGDYDDGHRLAVLWGCCRRIMFQIWPDQVVPEEVSLIDHFISDLDKVDTGSYSFRYWESTKKSGRTPNLEGIKHINIRHFRECVKSMTDFLSGVAMGIDAYLDASRQGL